MLLQATKLHNLDNFDVDSFWVDSSVDWIAKLAIGRSRGLLTIWKSGEFDLISSFFGKVFLVFMLIREVVLFIL